MSIWLLATRPKTWIASISPVLLGTTIAWQEGQLHPLLFLCTLLTALGIQITTNLANDYFDYLKGADTAERKGPLRVMQAGLVTSQKMSGAILLSCIVTSLFGCVLIYRGGAPIAGLLILSLILALLYTAGPYPLAYAGLGDPFVLLFFGPIAVTSTHYLQTLHFSLHVALVGCSIGLFSTAILIANNLRDIDEDRKANKKTLPVRFGSCFGQIEYSAAVLSSPLPLLLFCDRHPFLWLPCLIWLPALPLIRALKTKEYSTLFIKTGKLLWLFTFLTCLGWIL